MCPESPFVLAPGQSCQWFVRLSSSAKGTYSGDFSIVTDCARQPLIKYSFVGCDKPACPSCLFCAPSQGS